jgi:D-alanyl-D-alanine carboxypeptidase/D-alanyl-D-alanine-endopeptidase (penicillin-binding protein 4)
LKTNPCPSRLIFQTFLIGVLLAGSILWPIFFKRGAACAETDSLPTKSIDAEINAVAAQLKALIGPRDAVLLADKMGRTIFSINENNPLTPASTLKLLTSLAALHYLTEDFRFKTEFYLDNHQNLKIKGYGDPLLISAVLNEIAMDLSEHVSQFNDLILDASYFGTPVIIPGVTPSLQPYDAPNGALCVNFNTVHFDQDEKGLFVSAEPETPLLPHVLPKIRQSGFRQGRIMLSSKHDELVRYAGHLFQYFFLAHGISSSGNIKMGKVAPSSDRLVYTYRSRYPLTAVIQKLLEYSNNYMANQLLLAAAAQIRSAPGTLDKGIEMFTEFAKKELRIDNIRIAEGSGISRENRLTAGGLLKVLNQFTLHHTLLRKENNVYYKTGTLTGVRTRAGYILNPDGNLMPFVILINTPHKSDTDVLKQLIRYAEWYEKQP